MYYNLCMSANQIARCNRALPSTHHLRNTQITRTWNDITTQEDVVLLTAEGIHTVIAALRANPESTDRYRDEDFESMDIEQLNLADIDTTLELVLEDAPSENMLHGVCI
jgi:hypothetical protein